MCLQPLKNWFQLYEAFKTKFLVIAKLSMKMIRETGNI